MFYLYVLLSLMSSRKWLLEWGALQSVVVSLASGDKTRMMGDLPHSWHS